MSSATTLTPSDATTLSLLFDPESAPSASVHPTSPSLPADPHYSSETLVHLQTTEKSAIALAESSNPSDALPVFDSLLESHPLYASGYNNRAQLRRLLGHSAAEVLADLDKAIELAQPAGKLEPISPLQSKVLSAAWTQKGGLLLKDAKEEDAVKAFSEGARFGGTVAREMTVRLNPYARLCGSIVKEAMRKEMMGSA